MNTSPSPSHRERHSTTGSDGWGCRGWPLSQRGRYSTAEREQKRDFVAMEELRLRENDPPLRRAGYHKYIHDPSPPAEECHEDTVSFRKPESRRTPVIVRHLKSSDSSISGMPTNPGIAIQEPSPGGASISSLVRLHWTISNALRYSEPRRRTIHNMETTIPTVHGNISPPVAEIQVIRESVSYLETLHE